MYIYRPPGAGNPKKKRKATQLSATINTIEEDNVNPIFYVIFPSTANKKYSPAE